MGTARVMMFTPISRINLAWLHSKDLCYSLRWAIVSELCSKEFAVQLLSSPLKIQMVKLIWCAHGSNQQSYSSLFAVSGYTL